MVHSLDPLGKACYRQLWNNWAAPAVVPHWSFAYQKGRRRERLVLLRKLSRWYATQARHGYVEVNTDATNAFASTLLVGLDDTVCREFISDHTVPKQREEAQIMMERYHNACISVHHGDDYIDIQPQTVVLPGDAIAGELFIADMHPLYLKWSETKAKNVESLFITNPFCGTTSQINDTVYGAEVNTGFIANSAAQVVKKSISCVSPLVEAANIAGVQLNSSKEAYVVGLKGGGSKVQIRRLCSTGFPPAPPGKIFLQKTSLGTVTHNLSYKPEIDARIQAASAAWCAMGFFWTSAAPAPVLRRIFRALVYSAITSGLCALVLTVGEQKRINNWVINKGRIVMRGGGHAKKASVPLARVTIRLGRTTNVYRWLAIAPVHIELRSRRLRWLQDMCANLANNQCVLGAIFGTYDAEKASFVDGVVMLPTSQLNPWLKQYLNGVKAIGKVPDMEDIIVIIMRNYTLLIGNGDNYKWCFFYFDASILRFMHLRIQVVEDEQMHAQQNDVQLSDCDIIDPETGLACGRVFPTIRQLRQNQLKGKCKGHNLFFSSKLAISNPCPWCETIYKSTCYAAAHADAAIRNGRCKLHQPVINYDLEYATPITCKLCSCVFDTIDLYKVHVHEQFSLLKRVSRVAVMPVPLDCTKKSGAQWLQNKREYVAHKRKINTAEVQRRATVLQQMGVRRGVPL